MILAMVVVLGSVGVVLRAEADSKSAKVAPAATD
jgi:hypothetical protein